MVSRRTAKGLAASLLIAGLCASASGAQLVDVRTVDEQYVMVHWLDGEVEYAGDSGGPAGIPKPGEAIHDTIKRYEPALDTAAAVEPGNYTITSRDDQAYAEAAHPTNVYRKSKVSGTDNARPDANYTLEHTVFLRLPRKLQQGKTYTLAIAPQTNSNALSASFGFDIFRSVSEALHVNIIGYNPDHTAVKSADLYMWLGDGGARDYSGYVGRKAILYNVETGERHEVGQVSFWKPEGADFGNWNLTKSDVWNCDFSAFSGTGKFRLAVDGIGCSPDFTLSRDVYYEPFKNSVRGFFYMRLGMDTDCSPPPRQPRYIQDVDPPGFKVYRTTFGPWHPDWQAMRGDVWDRKDEWAKYKEPGDPTNPNAWGGHADAADLDRHAGHISIIWDMLLPYFLSNGKIGDDDLNIAESGNGIPDIIDEARYEVDFWLRLRDGQGGYCFGLNNPTQNDLRMYQAGACPYMAWANAANCAMMAECMRIAGKPELMKQYTDAALEAWRTADGGDLDFSYGIGNGTMRGRDLKMMAGAFLYIVTGDRAYEDAMAQESVATGPESDMDNPKAYCQYWGTAAYLMCAKNGWQPIHYPELLANMRASILHEALQKNVAPSERRPSRRSSNEAYGWFQATEMVQPLCIAHAVSTDAAERNVLLKAMLLEADYGLGRNTLNMVEMTGLGSRCVQSMFAPGRRDGVPGVDPGLTPYMNADAWGRGYMADPQWYASKGYPTWDKWPQAEALWDVRYCYSNNEFTPQQTMRGKTALLGYLYSLGQAHTAR
jgi:endoglucanase